MNQLSAKSIRHAVGHLAMAGIVFAFGGCQACCPTQNRQMLMTAAACDSIEINAGYRETRWTSLEFDSHWETMTEIEEDWPELDSRELPSIILEQARPDEPTVEASLEIQMSTQSTQRSATEIQDSDTQKYSDAVMETDLEQVEIEYIN